MLDKFSLERKGEGVYYGIVTITPQATYRELGIIAVYASETRAKLLAKI